MYEKELNTKRNHGAHYWQVKEGSIWRDEVVKIAEAGSEPVVEVGTTKCSLYRFQKEYAIHYKMYIREKHG